jgi:hypothetical protein
MDVTEDPKDVEPEPESEAQPEDDEERRGFRRGLFSSILEGGAAIRRGQGVVSDIAVGTKEEVVRLIGAEVRGFLDKMDVVDLMQDVVAGLAVEINAEIRFKRTDEGVTPEVVRNDAKIVEDADPPPEPSDEEG